MRAHSLHMLLAPVVGQYTVNCTLDSQNLHVLKNQQFAGDR